MSYNWKRDSTWILPKTRGIFWKLKKCFKIFTRIQNKRPVNYLGTFKTVTFFLIESNEFTNLCKKKNTINNQKDTLVHISNIQTKRVVVKSTIFRIFRVQKSSSFVNYFLYKEHTENSLKFHMYKTLTV